MKYDYREAMKLSNQLCFPLYAASRNVIGQYTPYLNELGLTSQVPSICEITTNMTAREYRIVTVAGVPIVQSFIAALIVGYIISNLVFIYGKTRGWKVIMAIVLMIVMLAPCFILKVKLVVAAEW